MEDERLSTFSEKREHKIYYTSKRDIVHSRIRQVMGNGLIFLSIILFFNTISFAQDIEMVVNIVPEFGIVREIGYLQEMPIEHNGTNCKYSLSFNVYSNLGSQWGIKISAPEMISNDKKDIIDKELVNYKLYGGTGTAIPLQFSNIWLPLPKTETIIYRSANSEKTISSIPFRFVVFVTPKISQMYKTYHTKVKIELVPL